MPLKVAIYHYDTPLSPSNAFAQPQPGSPMLGPNTLV